MNEFEDREIVGMSLSVKRLQANEPERYQGLLHIHPWPGLENVGEWVLIRLHDGHDFEDFANRSIVSVSTLQELVSREHDHDDGLAVNGPGSRFPAAGQHLRSLYHQAADSELTVDIILKMKKT